MSCSDVFRMKLNEHLRVSDSRFFDRLIEWSEQVDANETETRPASFDIAGGFEYGGISFDLDLDYKDTQEILNRWRNEKRDKRDHTLSKDEYNKYFEKSLPESVQLAMIDAWSKCNTRESGGISFASEIIKVDVENNSTRVDLKISHVNNDQTSALRVLDVFPENLVDAQEDKDNNSMWRLKDAFVFDGNSITLRLIIPNNDSWARISIDLGDPCTNKQERSISYAFPPAIKIIEEHQEIHIPGSSRSLIGHLSPNSSNDTMDSDSIGFHGRGALTYNPNKGELFYKASLSIIESNGTGKHGDHPTYYESVVAYISLSEMLGKQTRFQLKVGDKSKLDIPDMNNIGKTLLDDECRVYLNHAGANASVSVTPSNAANLPYVDGGYNASEVTQNGIVSNYAWDPNSRFFAITWPDFKVIAITRKIKQVEDPRVVFANT